MTRYRPLSLLLLCGLALPAAGAQGGVEPDTLPTVERYVEARGGLERWRRLRSLQFEGQCAAFSETAPCTLVRQRGDLYRLDLKVLGEPAIRARDAKGTWGRHQLLMPEASRIEEDPYQRLFERESLFEPPLLDVAAHGVRVRHLGPGEIDGIATVGLELTFEDGSVETWHLDAATGLEVAVDSQVQDLTQGEGEMVQRAFFSDFRTVDGLVLPFRVDLEFGARLETMAFDKVTLDPDLAPDLFRGPDPQPAAE